MGWYTELVMAIELKRDTPPKIIEILEYLIHWDGELPEIKSSHPLFETRNWESVIRGDSYYFPGKSNSTLEHDEMDKSYYLTVRSNLKNYYHEIEKFMHWLAPFSQTGTFTPPKNGFPPTGPGRRFAGYFCDGDDVQPTLIYFQEGKVYLSDVGFPELKVIEF
jgi:hypothetical protein